MQELTFKNGSFYYNSKKIDVWGAVSLRDHADQIARKVFNRILVKKFVAPTGPLPKFLDAHQVEGVRFVLTRSRSYLAHAPGAGKTAQAIIASLYIPTTPTGQCSFRHGQTLFIVPPTLTKNWEREILKWTDWVGWLPSIYIVGRTAEQWNSDWNADFIVVPDSMLTKDWVYDELQKRRFKLIAVDEASRFKEPSSERTLALFGGRGKRMYFGLPSRATYSVLLDGSPMPNRPLELWAPIAGMAGETIRFMSLHDFGVRYCNGHWREDKFEWDYSGASRQDELREKLKPFMHVVTESQLTHPERLRSMLFMNPDGSADLKEWEQKNLSQRDVAVVLHEGEDSSLAHVAKHRQKIGLSKVKWVTEYVRGLLETKNESLLIFAWHQSVCRAIANGLGTYRPGLVTGSTHTSEREDIFRRFQSGACRVIVGNIAAMGRGHNLQRAGRVVMAEYSWTDELNKQAEKRASRKGSTNQFVRCDYVVASGTMDEVILNSVFTKARNVERIIA